MTDYAWINGVSGDWSDSGVWDNGEPNTSDAVVTIGATGTYTVEINNSEGFAVDSLAVKNAGTTVVVDGTLSLNGGFSIVAGKMTGDGFLNVGGGTIGGGIVSVANQTITGAVTLSASLKDTGQVSLGSSGADTLAMGTKTLTLTGTGSTIGGTLTGKGTLALAGGTQAVNSGASLAMAKIMVTGGDSVSLNTSLTYAGSLNVTNGTALTMAGGKMLTLTGSARFSGTVTGAVKANHAKLTLNTAGVGTQLAASGGSLSVMRDLTYSGTLNDNGGAVMLGGNTLTVTGNTILTNVTFMTAGTLTTKGATALAGIAVKAGAILSNSGSATIKGQVVLGDLQSAGRLVNAKGATLTLTSGQAAAAIVDPAGRNADRIGAAAATRPISTLRNMGRVQLSRGGSKGGVRGGTDHTSHIAVTFQNLDTGTVAVRSGTLEFDGLFSNINGKAGAVSVASGTVLDLHGGGSSGAGAFSVAAGGLLEFTGGTFTLSAGKISGAVSLTAGALKLGAAAVTLAGGFTQGTGSTIDGSGVLTVSGAASFSGGTSVAAQTGSGRTLLLGATTVAEDIAIDKGRVFENHGTLTWSGGNFELGRNPLGVSQGDGSLKNTGTFIIASNGTIAGYAGKTALTNSGTILKANTGSVLVSTQFLNLGAVKLSGGTLELGGVVTGSGGVFRISNGAVLAADAALPAGQALIFGAGGGKLIVNDAAEFAATISGFGAQTAFDITGFKFSGKPKTSFVEAASNKKGVLTITDGSQTLKVTLFGQYVAAGFHLASDGAAGGTLVTYTAPAAHIALATPH